MYNLVSTEGGCIVKIAETLPCPGISIGNRKIHYFQLKFLDFRNNKLVCKAYQIKILLLELVSIEGGCIAIIEETLPCLGASIGNRAILYFWYENLYIYRRLNSGVAEDWAVNKENFSERYGKKLRKENYFNNFSEGKEDCRSVLKGGLNQESLDWIFAERDLNKYCSGKKEVIRKNDETEVEKTIKTKNILILINNHRRWVNLIYMMSAINSAAVLTNVKLGNQTEKEDSSLRSFTHSHTISTKLISKYWRGSPKKPLQKKINKKIHSEEGNKKFVKKFVSVYYTNIPGVVSKQNVESAIISIIHKFSPDVLYIGEVDAKLLSLCNVDDYIFEAGSGMSLKRQRMGCFIKCGVKYEKWSINNVSIPNLGITIGRWRTIGIYREWAAGADMKTISIPQQEERWKQFVHEWAKLKGRWTCLLGDLNICMSGRESQQANNMRNMKALIEDEILARGWSQLIKSDTRIQKIRSKGTVQIQKSCLDHLYLKEVDYISKIVVENVTGFDHSTIGGHLLYDKPVKRPEVIELRKIDDIPEGDFQNLYLRSGFQKIFQSKDPDEAIEIFEDVVHSVLNILAPLKKIHLREKYLPYVTLEIEDKMKERNESRKKAIESKKEEDWEEFKEKRREVLRLLRKAKYEHDAQYLDVDDTKQQWSRVKIMSGLASRERTEMKLEIDGRIEEDPKKNAAFMNSFFKEKVTKLIQQISPSKEEALSYMQEHLESKKIGSFDFHLVSFDEILQIIRRLNNTTSIGRDGLGVKIIKNFRDVLAPALQYICNLSIVQSSFPKAWKKGIVIPLPKKGNLQEAKNWRPINLLPICSKILEMVMNDQYVKYVEAHELFSKSQHAYRRNRSTVSAWVEIDTNIRQAAEKGWTSVLVTTDLSAAFNTLSKEIMVPMMKATGVSDMAGKLIESYLSDRKTQVKLGNEISTEISLDTGVGEGSIQGPSYFISILMPVPVIAKRTNERLEKLGVSAVTATVEYADDCTGIVNGETELDCQIAIVILSEEFSKFYSRVGLKQNLEKSELLAVRKCDKTFDFTVGEVTEAEEIKLLGLTVQSGMKFNKHISKTSAAVRHRLHEISKIQHLLPFDLLKRIIESLCLSKLYYAMEVYNTTREISKQIQRTMNVCLRVACHGDMKTRIKTMLEKTGWLNADNKTTFVRIMMLRKIMLTRCCSVTWSLIQRGTIHGHNTRDNRLNLTWNPLTKFAGDSVLTSAVQKWNFLGLSAWDIVSKTKFKNKLPEEIIKKFGNDNL